jgi:uncharacterized protein YraI
MKNRSTFGLATLASIAAAVILLMVCGCTAAVPQDTALVGADDSVEASADALTGSIPVGSILRVTASGLNFRKGASTSYGVIRVLPEGTNVTVAQSSPQNAFYKVTNQGSTGWVHGNYVKLVSTPGDDDKSDNPDPGTDPAPSAGRAGAIERAKAGVGFSYWWGHGRWQMAGPTSSTKGSCSGSCPSCSHSGSNGADCSGFVGKVWQVGSSDSVSVDEHPYSTGSFVSDTSKWKTVSRSSLLKADALVYNNGSSGHVALYESGDGWGSMWLYECRGCSYGCVHNNRSLSSSYHGIRRSGY